MITDIKAKIDQIPPSIGAEGDFEYVKQTKLGQLFTADWKLRLLLAGKVWKVSIGAITAGNAITQVTGGGDGTVMDMEQPEFIVGVDAGYFLIPIAADVIVTSDTDAPDDFMEILLIMDRTNSCPTSATATVATPINLLDGGGSFPGRAFTAVTVDIEDPVYDELLAYERYETTAVVMQGTSANEDDAINSILRMHYEPQVPSIGAGPCSIVCMWDGTVATTGIACFTFAAVPISWFPTS